MSKATKEHAYYCFEVLEKALNKKNKSKPHGSEPTGTDASATLIGPQITNESYPLFVTWNIMVDNTGDEELRGCIGNFSGMPLKEGLEEYAIVSALQDPRFDPVSLEELSALSCGVSLLVEFEDGDNYLDWTIGVHGIRIKFVREGLTYSGTYLPEIAEEQGWTKVQTVKSLVRKAGFISSCTEDILDSIKLRRYQSHKVKATYEEYKGYIESIKE